MMPVMYRDNMYVRTGTYTDRIKIFIRNTSDWLEVNLRKSDVDYIGRHRADRKSTLDSDQACTVTAMESDGTIARRVFLSLPAEEDSLPHAINRIKKVQQRGASACGYPG